MNDSNQFDLSNFYGMLLQTFGNNLSNFEQFALIIHSMFNKFKFIPKNYPLDRDWNKEYGKAIFEYSFKIPRHLNNSENLVNIQVQVRKNEDNCIIDIIADCDSNGNNGKVKIDSSINMKNDMVTKMNFNDLNESAKEFEEFVKTSYVDEIIKIKSQLDKSSISNQNNQNNINQNINPINPFGGEVDPNNYMLPKIGGYTGNTGFGEKFNPYFSTGGGSFGGSLIGPNSDIFQGHMFPHPHSNIHPNIRYDPIGPFGTFGGPEPNIKDMKKTDPYYLGNPFKDIKSKPNKNNQGGFGGGWGGDPFI